MSAQGTSEIQLEEGRVGIVMPALKSVICGATSQFCAERCGGMLRAIVLTGSLARDEATFLREGDHRKLLGDAEFLLVFMENATLPSPFRIAQLEREIEDCLLQGGLSAHVELSPVHTRYLRSMPPEIFAYELRTCGQAVWGERQILSLVPAFSPSDIPLEDGWRMLCNRIVEFIEVIDPVAERSLDPSPEARYRMIKLYLDMATSFLLFHGAYAPTYLERAERLKALVSSREVESREVESCSLPFPLREFAQRVAYSTRLKLQVGEGVDAEPVVGPNGVQPVVEKVPPGIFSWTELVTYARRLWRWELERLTACAHFVGAYQVPPKGTASRTPTDRELMRRWMRLQPVRRRLRGWASALRRCGWHRSWRQWPHWVKLGWRGSPRYWVYAAASGFFFRLPGILNGDGCTPEVDSELRTIRSWLPVAGDWPRMGANLGWRDVAADIAWNYHAFLQGTRT